VTYRRSAELIPSNPTTQPRVRAAAVTHDIDQRCAVPDGNARLLRGGQQHRVQIRTVHRHRRQAIPAADESGHLDQQPATRIAEPVAVEREARDQALVKHTNLAETPQRVRRQHQPNSERRVRRLRLDNLHIDSPLCQGNSRAQAADPCADHQNPHGVA
jgi:ABC-type lipoprotein export system ATPase subunit